MRYWPCGQNSQPEPECHQQRDRATRREARVTGFDCGPVAVSAGVSHRSDGWVTTRPARLAHRIASRPRRQLPRRMNGHAFMSTSRAGTPAEPHLLALERANHIRTTRAELKRQLRTGQVKATQVILRSSRDTDTMTVIELLSSQRGWGPARSTKILRSVSLPELKTLGSLTERQRLTLAGALSIGQNNRRTVSSR